MNNRFGRLWAGGFVAFLAACLFLLSFRTPTTIGLVGIVASVILALIGATYWIDYAIDVQDNHRYERNTADAITPERAFVESKIKLAEAMHNLTPEQAKVVENSMSPLDMELDFDGNYYLRGTDIPDWFIKDFLMHSRDDFLCAMTYFGVPGDSQYELAHKLTMRFVEVGLATFLRDDEGRYLGGNRPARWRDRRAKNKLLKKWRFLEDEEYHLPPNPTSPPHSDA